VLPSAPRLNRPGTCSFAADLLVEIVGVEISDLLCEEHPSVIGFSWARSYGRRRLQRMRRAADYTSVAISRILREKSFLVSECTSRVAAVNAFRSVNLDSSAVGDADPGRLLFERNSSVSLSPCVWLRQLPVFGSSQFSPEGK